MYPLLINPIPLLLTLSAAFGVLIHDTQVDRAASTIMSTPVAIVSSGESGVSSKMNDLHVHSERVSVPQNVDELKTSQPRTKPRDGDDKKYVVQKKSSLSLYGSEYIWPSI